MIPNYAILSDNQNITPINSIEKLLIIIYACCRACYMHNNIKRNMMEITNIRYPLTIVNNPGSAIIIIIKLYYYKRIYAYHTFACVINPIALHFGESMAKVQYITVMCSRNLCGLKKLFRCKYRKSAYDVRQSVGFVCRYRVLNVRDKYIYI